MIRRRGALCFKTVSVSQTCEKRVLTVACWNGPVIVKGTAPNPKVKYLHQHKPDDYVCRDNFNSYVLLRAHTANEKSMIVQLRGKPCKYRGCHWFPFDFTVE